MFSVWFVLFSCLSLLGLHPARLFGHVVHAKSKSKNSGIMDNMENLHECFSLPTARTDSWQQEGV